ncbi:MAG TPA: glycoside hydrolase family 27 protein [Bryobacteraceae bacterium]|nr:glycoside hydrolase family 27 protein [Bryobacteraceae bacterium]
MKRIVLFCSLAAAAWSADLTGNWLSAAPSPNNDGTIRRTYFHLKQEGGKITGTIRAAQFFYAVMESTGGPDGFKLTVGMQDGPTERRAIYEGRLVGDELHVAQRRGETLLPEMTAHRVREGEGAKPARLPLPALHKVRDNGLARTPPMGWNSWNKFAGRVNDEVVRGVADAMARNGMKEAGYTYINIDDTWEGERDAQGNIQTNKKFPDMKALADYVHGKGLKLGIYSSPGPNTCAGYEGTYGHEEQDARTWAAWGIDYLKYDWCGARNIYSDAEMQAVYQKMGDALLATGRPIVFSLCQYGRADVWKWGPDVGGNLWRTTYDIRDNWESMAQIGFQQSELAQWAKPGHWNDPDMLEIGNGGMSETEYRTHMTLWSMLAAPLMAGNDVRDVPSSILEILTNREVIAINQDKAGKQGRRLAKSGDQEIWVRDLEGGDRAVALFNRGAAAAPATIDWTALGIKKAPAVVRDLWEHRDERFTSSVSVPGHGVVLLRLRAE